MLVNVSNILRVLDKATPEDIYAGVYWYDVAHRQCKQIAELHDIPMPVMCGLVAVLSPSVSWPTNIDAAIRLIAGESKIAGYGANVGKARLLLATDDLSLVTGPKVSAFARALLAPAELLDEVVIDRHALAIWEGSRGGQVGRRHKAIERDYQVAAKLAGMHPRHLQATTWVTLRAHKELYA